MQYPLLTVVTPPAPLITTADAKAHLRVDYADDDALIDGLVAAATQDIDGPDGWLGRALGTQTLKLTASHFPGCGDVFDWRFGAQTWCYHHVDEIRLRCPPIQSVDSIVYKDATGATQSLDPATYAQLDRILFPLGGASWPATGRAPDAVTVTYVAGYAADALPAPIRAAILLKLGDLYSHREDATAVASPASDRLLAPWRVFA